MYFRGQIEAVCRGLEDLKEDLVFQRDFLPEGTLIISERKGSLYYYQRFPKTGNRKKERRVGITNDSEVILALVRKRYIEAALKRLECDIDAVHKMMDRYQAVDEESVMKEFCDKYHVLRAGIYYGLRNPQEWAEDFNSSSDFYVEDLKSVSSKGEDMRSGGEMYISSRLDHYGIPYRYEQKLDHPDLNYAPDFTILRPRDRKIFYWEHFGMVNDYDYVLRNIGKIRDYIGYGIKPWDNLIMTFNNEKGGYNGKLIDAMIECWLL